METHDVFPPSETSLALAEVCLRLEGRSCLDVGTGSGILAIALAKAGNHRVIALDSNPDAIECARLNAAANGVEQHIEFLCTDFTSYQGEEPPDLLVSNPPFMPMPRGSRFVSPQIGEAINGGPDGTEVMLAFADHARTVMSSEGRFVFGAPHFVDLDRMLSILSRWYEVATLEERPIRYWLAEFDERFAHHLESQRAWQRGEVSSERGFLLSALSIIECRLSR